MSIRLDQELSALLSEGSAKTPLNKQQLVRRTLRLFLRQVIDQESARPVPRVTTIDPWPKGALTRAYKQADKGWERVEAAAAAAQGRVSFED
jgi:hypothetical protein